MSLLQSCRKSLLLILMTLVAQPVLATVGETRWYDVEVILFAQTNQDYRHSEAWPIDYTPPDMDNAKELLPQDKRRRDPARPTAFRLLDERELNLNADAKRIDKAPDLQLLGHFGWRQPGLPQQGALAVKVDQTLFKRLKRMGLTAAPKAGEEEMATATPKIEGTLRLILSRYLHIETNLLLKEALTEQPGYNDQQANVLLFNEPATATDSSSKNSEPDLFAMAEENAASAPYRVYFMHQSRRMRSKETHYLDHPVFGMVIRVVPHQPKVTETSQ